MNTRAESKAKETPPEEAAPTMWFATFSLLDVNGAVGSAQYERLFAPLRKLWRRMSRRRPA